LIDIDERTLDELAEFFAEFASKPLEFVLAVFPWGQGELASRTGPERWQTELLSRIGAGLSPSQAVLEAVASGHGVGKSALVAWIILWAMSTATDTRGVVTANTETQLKTKTWAELAKWHRLFIGRELFKLEATSLFSVDPEHTKTWRVDMVAWSERNPEAFAGLHNQGRRVFMIYDEASSIPDIIWETSEGFLTDENTERLWLVCGNPTRSSGRFRSAFDDARWHTTQVDAREVSFTNKNQISAWADAYGDDSDFFRVRVKGVFPRVGSLEFISAFAVAEARQRDASTTLRSPFDRRGRSEVRR
jgi:transposase-like protein